MSGIPFCKVRVDDILISGKDDEEHLKNLELVLKRLYEAGLKLKREKCRFFMTEVTYLGFRVNKEAIKPVPEKVSTIRLAPAPANVTELKSYLGMLQYYNHHLPNLSTVTEPLHILMRKGSEWRWDDEQQKAFDLTKSMLCEAPLLAHFDPKKPTVLYCDASPYGLGAVLAHRMVDGSEKPVCYISRTLSLAEKLCSYRKRGVSIGICRKKTAPVFVW